MGIEADRIMEAFDGPFEALIHGQILQPAPTLLPASSTGYFLDAQVNDSFKAVNDLLKAKVKVYRTQVATKDVPAGSFYVPSAGKKVLELAAKSYGVLPKAAKGMPSGAKEISPARIGLYDYYGGSMPSGWTRWIMEQFHFDYAQVFPMEIDGGKLKDKFDVLLFIGPGMPGAGGGYGAGAQPKKETEAI
jgi:hypothetical protein